MGSVAATIAVEHSGTAPVSALERVPSPCLISGGVGIQEGLEQASEERRTKVMTNASKPQSGQDEETRQFIETLEKTGQLVDVDEHEDTSRLPAQVTHVRYPDGTVKRIRFTGPGRR